MIRAIAMAILVQEALVMPGLEGLPMLGREGLAMMVRAVLLIPGLVALPMTGLVGPLIPGLVALPMTDLEGHAMTVRAVLVMMGRVEQEKIALRFVIRQNDNDFSYVPFIYFNG